MPNRPRDVPVVSAASAVLAHVPNLVRYGSKPSRTLPSHPELQSAFDRSLRTYDGALGYPPHQAYVGAVHPRDLGHRPWVGQVLDTAERYGPTGEIMPEQEFLGMMAAVDEFGLVAFNEKFLTTSLEALEDHPLNLHKALDTQAATSSIGKVDEVLREPGALPLYHGGEIVGAIRAAHEHDESLTASILLENLACKTTGVLATLHLLKLRGLEPTDVDYLLSCSEEAVGDRYQRGGGNMAKAVGAASGLTNASGADIKNFCAAPVPALVMAGSLILAAVFDRVLVVAGGSVPKLGMKFEGHLQHNLPLLEDVLGGTAVLVERDDGRSARLRIDAVGCHRIGAGGSNPQIMEALAFEPLEKLGLTATDVDDYATELHNPEITEPQGSGNVPERNYKLLAMLAARRGEIEREEAEDFVRMRGMPGFAPTQGHLASAICYLPIALQRLSANEAQRVLLMAKGSLFLGRMTQLSDGMSVLLESQPS